MKKVVIVTTILLIVAVLAIAIPRMKGGQAEFKPPITIYKSMNCGCCGVYSDYMRRDFDVAIVNTEDPSIKDSNGVPAEMRSCHTTIIGDYFVEGHIPVEAIKKLMEEKPDIKGIAMPGMPSGSPGMPGAKKGQFIIYQVNNDGSYSEFMRL